MFVFNLIFPDKNILKISSKLIMIIFISFAVFYASNVGFSVKAAEQEPKYWSTIMQEDFIGHLNDTNKALRGRVITLEPGAVVKFHVHKVPGIRYVLEGTVSVKWKNGTSNTYKAGSTFFEGPVGNKPARAHEISNDGQVVAKVWNVELIPEGDMKK
jgi:quercetin dioxygenase-like cupin family protein